MKRISLYTGIIGLSLLFSGLSLNAQSVSILNQLNAKTKGVWIPAYMPKSKVYARVYVEKEELIKGDLAEFTSQYFNSDNYVKENSVKYRLADIKIRQEYTKDLNRVFFLQPNGGADLQFNNDGVLLSINAQSFPENKNELGDKVNAANPLNQFSHKPMLSIATKMDTVIIREYTQDSSLIERRTINRVVVKTQAADLAKELANKINAIREQKWTLISGPEDVHLDGKGLEISLKELEKLENKYLYMFFGERRISGEWVEIEIEPAIVSEQEIELGKFSPTEGWGKGFASVKVRLKSSQELSNAPITAQTLPYYENNPIKVELLQGSTLISSQLVIIPQLNILKNLPIENVKSVKVILDSQTGALLRFSK